MDKNLGLEGITFISDAFLLSKKFVDEVHGKVYDPNDYPDHGSGLFFVGLEGFLEMLVVSTFEYYINDILYCILLLLKEMDSSMAMH